MAFGSSIGPAGAIGRRQDEYRAFRVGATALVQRGFLAAMNDPVLALAEPFEPPMENGQARAGFGAFSFNKGDIAFIDRFNSELGKYLGTPEHRALLGKYGFGADEITPALTVKSEDLVR